MFYLKNSKRPVLMESLNGTEGSRALIQSVLHLTLWQAQVNASYRESQRAIADSDDGPAADVVHCDGRINCFYRRHRDPLPYALQRSKVWGQYSDNSNISNLINPQVGSQPPMGLPYKSEDPWICSVFLRHIK